MSARCVNAVFSGPDDIDERIKPQKGITYFVNGSSGELRRGDTRPSAMTAADSDQDQAFSLVEISGDDMFFQARSRAGRTVDGGVVHRAAGSRPRCSHESRHGDDTRAHRLRSLPAPPIGALIALIWANTAAESYFIFAHRLSFAVNEIGMAFFFALMAQEVAEAVMPGGALHTWRRWALAVVAAIGGMVGAVTVFLGYVHLNFVEVMVPPGRPPWRSTPRCLLRAEDDHAAQRRRPVRAARRAHHRRDCPCHRGARDTSRSRPAPAARRSCSPPSAWRRPCGC